MTTLIESSDDRQLLRPRCPKGCGYEVAIAIWCHDAACCNQSPFGFVLEALGSAQAVRGIPVFALRFLDPVPADGYDPDVRVRVWRAGCLSPVFTGRSPDAARFEMQHDCQARSVTKRTATS